MEICTTRTRMTAACLASATWICLLCAGCSADKDRTAGPSVVQPAAAKQTEMASDHAREAVAAEAHSAGKRGTSSAIASSGSALDYLPSESSFVLNEGISIRKLEHLLHSSRAMSDAIDRMSQEAASSPEALALTAHYRFSLLRAMGQTATLDRLSCGLSICIGIARAESLTDHEAWGRRITSDPSSPTFSYGEAFEDIAGGYENRFIFSTDPALNAISGN